MIEGDLTFVFHKLSYEEKQKILDEAIYLIDSILEPEPRKLNLVDVADRFKIDTLQMKLRALKKQI